MGNPAMPNLHRALAWSKNLSHVFDLQFFNRCRAMLLDEFCRLLVQVVVSRVGDLLLGLLELAGFQEKDHRFLSSE
jgi:hypothetical protein